MFEFVPILNGKYFNYREYLFILTIVGFSLFSGTAFLISALLNRSKRFKLNFLNIKAKTRSSSEDYLTDASSTSPESYGSIGSSENETLIEKKPRSGTKAGNAANWVGWFFLSCLPGIFATFQILIPMWLGAILDFIIIMLRLRYKMKSELQKLYLSLKDGDRTDSYDVQARILKGFYQKLAIFFTTMSVVLPVIFNGFCVSAYQDYVGPILGTASLSSEFSRFFQLSKACPPGAPCHMYATLPEDGATSVFINVHTDESYETIGIFYDTDEYYGNTTSFRRYNDSVSYIINGTDSRGKRRVHTFYLNELQPDSLYYFHIIYDNAVQAKNYYRTLPDENNPRDLVIVQGGDMGDTIASKKIMQAVAQTNPDVIILGGDIAYDNGMCSCYFTWDILFKDLDELNIKNGRLIPLILAVGNHDVGLDSLTGKNLKLTDDGPFYMTFFPQHSGVDEQGALVPKVPTLEERKTYHYHKLGKILVLNMDSGYVTDIESQQAWMRQVLDENPTSIKFANYHVPFYFACKGNDANLMDVVQAQKDQWGPVFDEYKFAIAFENHEHHLKRTFPLKNNTRDDQGTLYIGNGQWGTQDSSNCESYNQTGIYESVQNIHHFWLMNVSFSQGTIKNTAYDGTNTPILDVMSQNIDDFLFDY